MSLERCYIFYVHFLHFMSLQNDVGHHTQSVYRLWADMVRSINGTVSQQQSHRDRLRRRYGYRVNMSWLRALGRYYTRDRLGNIEPTLAIHLDAWHGGKHSFVTIHRDAWHFVLLSRKQYCESNQRNQRATLPQAFSEILHYTSSVP